MAENDTPAGPIPQTGYAEVWTAAALEVIQSLSGDTRWAVAAPEGDGGDPVIEMVAFLELRGELTGIQQIRLHRGEGRAWAQLGVPPSEDAPRIRSTPLDDAERDALAEVLRQVLTAAAAGLGAGGWGAVEIELRHLGPLRRTVENGEGTGKLCFAHADGARLEFGIAMDSALRDQIRFKLNPGSAPPRTPVGERGVVTSSTKFDMLLDVELDVTLRFGNRQMLLHDVAELAPGSVLELDRQIDDPVELLVGGKIVAWGEVVVVDGNYGLRLNRLVHRRERMAALEAAR
ncbi:MAG: FliM/FliN family flagellar motor switch protein [Terriglobales bacterium]